MPPFLSILIPTRNRLNLLAEALATVRRQDAADIEVIVSDNASEADIGGHVAQLGDGRLRYLRSETALPVTENWNRALDAATGEYVVMLGDDDGLVPGYVAAVRSAVSELDQPDLIYHGAFHFAHPGVVPGAPEGFVVDVTPMHAILDDAGHQPMLLSRSAAEAHARAALDMRATYGFNMQYFLFRRSFLDTLRTHGPVFRGPYPDFYTANLALLTARRPAVLARPLTVIGISRQSYGFFHFNDREGEGINFLANAGYVREMAPELAASLLPGSEMDAQWLASVALVQQALAPQLRLPLGVRRYRRLQILRAVLRPFLAGIGYGEARRALWPHLTIPERVLLAGLTLLLKSRQGLSEPHRQALAQRLTARAGQHTGGTRAPIATGIVANGMVEVFDALAARSG